MIFQLYSIAYPNYITLYIQNTSINGIIVLDTLAEKVQVSQLMKNMLPAGNTGHLISYTQKEYYDSGNDILESLNNQYSIS